MQTISITPGYDIPDVPNEKLYGLQAINTDNYGNRTIGTLVDIGDTFPILLFPNGHFAQTNGHYELLFPLVSIFKEKYNA